MNERHETAHLEDAMKESADATEKQRPEKAIDAYGLPAHGFGSKTKGEPRPGPASGWRRSHAKERRLKHDELANAKSWSVWKRGGILVISALEDAEAPDGSKEVIPQWHLSMSAGPGKRCSDDDARATLACFWMSGAEEDNHHPGAARHYWMPLDPKRRVDCECKVDEVTITEPDGYRWTNPVDGDCRGCELSAATKGERPCSIHEPPSNATVEVVGVRLPDGTDISVEEYERRQMSRDPEPEGRTGGVIKRAKGSVSHSDGID